MSALQSIGEALLIGLLVGFQREASASDRQPGVRDFLVISLCGGICGLLGIPWLTVPALASIGLLLSVFRFQNPQRTGLTTELTAVATFALGYLTAIPGFPAGAPLAIGTSIVVVGFLEGKKALQKLIRETITETEFSDTLWFLAIIFIILPVLPQGEYGPYQFFSPRKVWMFVILISSISYIGYFLQKFLGTERGLDLTAVLGGLASTTAATASFARSVAGDRALLVPYLRAAVIANTMHHPRIFAILLIAMPELALACLPALLAMTLTGGVLIVLLRYSRHTAEAQTGPAIALGNPFRLAPALKLGAIFVVILFGVKAAAARFGSDAVYVTSAIGGSVDVDAIALSMADLVGTRRLIAGLAAEGVLIAITANAVLKTGIAFAAGARPLAWRLGGVFALMLSAGWGAWFAFQAAYPW
ncbi:MAG: MgtC/SapB family protein [Acidobacteria bacterium]|nr:MgtC/SapB family protein [Acidobacteriota bacterium]